MEQENMSEAELRQHIIDSWDKTIGNVKHDTIGNKLVSTIYYRLNHGRGKEDPTLWETMLFDENGDSIECEHYTSHADALKGHQRWCDKVKQEK